MTLPTHLPSPQTESSWISNPLISERSPVSLGVFKDLRGDRLFVAKIR
ncbi:MAG TPA: hypothetical protein V6C88_20785 [Chroococcidiopsis sp.]